MTVTVEDWAREYVMTTSLCRKLEPPAPPGDWCREPKSVRLEVPGRPPELRVQRRRVRSPKPEALSDVRCRARMLHIFWHHELQAAELMCWALLAFADAEPEFRSGLLRVCLDEIRHMHLYQRHIEGLGYHVGAFGVRDWFWQRVPSCESKVAFVALLGMGFEAANLEHAANYAAHFRRAGDEKAGELQERIGAEELAHVRFATRWFTHWMKGCRFHEWRQCLPSPLSPLVLRGAPCAKPARIRAGMPEAFVDALIAWKPADET